MADGYANMFRSAGFAAEVDALRAHQAKRDREGALAAISQNMIQAIDFIGSDKQVTDFVQGYVDAGVEHPVLMPMPWGEDPFCRDSTDHGGGPRQSPSRGRPLRERFGALRQECPGFALAGV